jgi:hypothetical protein
VGITPINYGYDALERRARMAKKQMINEYDSRMDRRQFLQLTGKAAVALGAGSLLAAYGPDDA